MSIKTSKYYRRTWRRVKLRISKAWSERDFDDLDKIIGSFDNKVISDAHAIAAALENVRMAARELHQIGSPAFRCPRGLRYEQIIRYHNVAALHEFGACRYRTIRLLNRFMKTAKKRPDLGREGGLKTLMNAIGKSWTRIQHMRDAHVHEAPYAPPRLWSVQYLTRGQSARSVEYKRVARQLSKGWTGLAHLMDADAEFMLELAALSLVESLTAEQLRTESRILLKKLERASDEVTRQSVGQS